MIYTSEGLNLSPPLRWSGAPADTQSFALVMQDPDCPAGLWVHWLLFNIPSSLRALPAGLERTPELANGMRHGECWGIACFERIGYQGPMPPAGTTHRYVFEFMALDTALELPAACTVFDLRDAVNGHVLARTELSGLYANAS